MPAGRPPQVNRDTVRQMLDARWLEGDRDLEYAECVIDKTEVGKQYFNRIKLEWKRERGLTGKARGIRLVPRYDDAEIKRMTAEIRAEKEKEMRG